MRRLVVLPLVVVAAFAVAACAGGGAATTAPTTAASAPAASGGGDGGGACAKGDAGATAAVTVEIKDFAYSPDPVTAKVGEAIGWTNGDSAPHTATLDDDSCGTDNLNQGSTGALVFSAAGTYPYHCAVHPSQMKGTITVTE
ncbi:MAG TPA: cupredoxin domain-containing protein [Candidatus Limnocylindrales bacterium]|nr:cupredoxin domain-containing protein [Candidatus Limnocylindrales bacterium]